MIKRVDDNTTITRRKMNEVIDALNRLKNVGGTAGVQVSEDSNGVTIRTQSEKRRSQTTLKVRCKNVGEVPLKKFSNAVVLSSLFATSDPAFATDAILKIRLPEFESDEGRNFVITAESIPVGGIGLCTITGLTPAYIYGTGSAHGTAGFKFATGQPEALTPSEPGAKIIHAVGGGVAAQYLGLVLLGAGDGGTADESGDTMLEIVATLPPVPTDEGAYKKVFWGNSTVIDGGTGDNQAWTASWKDTRWYPERPTTKNGTPGV
jgi:hypothetical protein